MGKHFINTWFGVIFFIKKFLKRVWIQINLSFIWILSVYKKIELNIQYKTVTHSKILVEKNNIINIHSMHIKYINYLKN